jgi:multidrug resistance protein, MATE family
MLDFRYKTLLGVALPMMVSGFIQSIVLITDASFISRYSTDAFDALGNGGLIYITMYMMVVGMSDGSQIIIARRIGENRIDAIGRIFGTTFFTLLMIGTILFLVLHFLIPDWIISYSANKNIALLQGEFLNIRSFSLFFAVITLSIQAMLIAKGKTVVVLIAAFITASTNVILAYSLIFGNFGLPRMGIEGAALASTLAEACSMTFLIIYLYFSIERREYRLFSYFSFQWKSFKELLKVGSPLMIQGFVALATWTLFFTWIEQKGQFDLTVSQNIRAIYFLAFVPIWGFAGTTKTYISQYIGSGHFEVLPIIQRRIQLLTFGFLLISFHGALLYPEALIRMINPAEIYIHKSAEILRLVSCSILLYGLISVYFQTIHGSGNTLISMLIEVISVVCYSIFSYLFIKVFNWDIYWIWTVEYIYFSILGGLSLFYLTFYNWKKKVL